MQKMTRTPARDFTYYDSENRTFTAADIELLQVYAWENEKGFYTVTNWNGEKRPFMVTPRREYSFGKLGKNVFTVNICNNNGDSLKNEIWVF